MLARRYLLTGIAALYFGGLIGLAFVHGSTGARTSWFWPFVLFVPVGLLLLLLMGRRRGWVAVGFGVLGAAWVEAAQTIWMPEGYADLGDVIWASIGVCVGVVLGLVFTISHSKSMRSHDSHRVVSQSGNREIPQD